MASASKAKENGELVILNCIEPHSPEPDANHREILISTADAINWNNSFILTHDLIKITADRKRLIQHSSYFYAILAGNFSESQLDCISIEWNIDTFLSVLKSMFGCPMDITADNVLPLFEAALFFGVDILISKCKVWLADATSDSGLWSLQLEDLIQLWKFGLEHTDVFVQEICEWCLAKNFMWAISFNSFANVPYDLLLSCLQHPCLTVDSEKDLCGVLLAWLDVNMERSTTKDCFKIWKQIRINLLPLWFIAGKRNCHHFSKLGAERISGLLTSAQARSIDELGDGDFSYVRIRLTEYSKTMDLSGCPNVELNNLLLSVLPSSYSTNYSLRKGINISALNHERFDPEMFQTSLSLWPITSFEAVQEVNISNCPMLHLNAAIECFSKSFPSLRILKAANFLDFSPTKLQHLEQRCPLLSDIDLTVDSSPIIPTRLSILSSTEARKPISLLSSRIYMIPYMNAPPSSPRMSQSTITRLILEGRTDIRDSDLQNISGLCVTLNDINLRACTKLTDAGIAALIIKCIKLRSVVVCDTSFGHSSVHALCSIIPKLDDTPHMEKISRTFSYELQTLHMGGCKGIDATFISELLSKSPKLKSLCLRDTEVLDTCLYTFFGSFLEMLDVSYTKVSAAALTHIVCRNPSLRRLSFRDCKNGIQKESNNTETLYFQLGKLCKLEEIEVGWGFSFFSLQAITPAVSMLRAINVGIGATVGEDGLKLISKISPLLESVILYFQVISDSVVTDMAVSLKNLKELSLSYCLGEITSLSFKLSMPNMKKLKLERVTPWMTNEDLAILTQSCPNLTEISLLGCALLNSESQDIMSKGWPGLISVHLEECGEVTVDGMTSLCDCKALEDLLLRHNGRGICRNFILDIASKMPMLRKVSLDLCDAIDGNFDIPAVGDRYFLSIVKIARCKSKKSSISGRRLRMAHKESLVLVWNSKALTTTVVHERL